MKRDDIIRMAEKSGAIHYWHLSNLERFAALVAAAEREACAKVCEQGLAIATSLSALDDMEMWGEKFAAAIRARGNT